MPSIGLGIHEIALENYRICKLYMNMMKVLGRQFNGDVIKINKSQEVKCNLEMCQKKTFYQEEEQDESKTIGFTNSDDITLLLQ